MKDKPMQE